MGGPDYPLVGVFARINCIGEMLREGNHKQQKRLLKLFDKILVGAATKIEGVELQKSAQPLLADLLMVTSDLVCL